MRKTSIAVAIAMALSMSIASVALAGEPTCSGVDTGHGEIANHGEHVTMDYVNQGEPGARGAPAHFGNTLDLGPGASFCLDQANSKALPPRP